MLIKCKPKVELVSGILFLNDELNFGIAKFCIKTDSTIRLLTFRIEKRRQVKNSELAASLDKKTLERSLSVLSGKELRRISQLIFICHSERIMEPTYLLFTASTTVRDKPDKLSLKWTKKDLQDNCVTLLPLVH